MNLDEFKALSPKDQEEHYNLLIEKREKHQHEMGVRCRTDVDINNALWQDLCQRLEDMYSKSKEAIDAGLVGGTRVSDDEVLYIDSLKGLSVDEHIDRLLTFVCFKMDCNRLQEETRWKADEKFLDESLEELNGLLEEAQGELEGVMPKVPNYAIRKKPVKPYKKNGELSASGEKWEEIRELIRTKATDDSGNLMVLTGFGEDGNDVKVLRDYSPPNINSSQQIKDFLYSKGWKPESFKFVRDKEEFQRWVESKPSDGSPRLMWSAWKDAKPKDRMVPQINVDGKDGKELCPSVTRLAEKLPEIMAYSKYSTVKHRRDLLKGFKEKLSEDGYLQASIGGFTNTFRMKHRAPLVNLPGVDKPYGKNVRGCLIAGEGKIMLGSDLSSLEDRVKHCYMLPHDPEYVQTMMADDFDAHTDMAVSAGFMTEQEEVDYKNGIVTEDTKTARKLGKVTNYSSVYGVGAPTLARSAEVDVKTAEKLLEGYWKRNWAVKAIAEEQYVIQCSRGLSWLVNPINGFCYSLRKESDRFSTLCQGTGSFIFDMWIDHILELMLQRFNKKRLTAQYHDEYISVFKDSERNRKAMEYVTHQALAEVNEEFMLRRSMGCDVVFGNNYAEVH